MWFSLNWRAPFRWTIFWFGSSVCAHFFSLIRSTMRIQRDVWVVVVKNKIEWLWRTGTFKWKIFEWQIMIVLYMCSVEYFHWKSPRRCTSSKLYTVHKYLRNMDIKWEWIIIYWCWFWFRATISSQNMASFGAKITNQVKQSRNNVLRQTATKMQHQFCSTNSETLSSIDKLIWRVHILFPLPLLFMSGVVHFSGQCVVACICVVKIHISFGQSQVLSNHLICGFVYLDFVISHRTRTALRWQQDGMRDSD